MTHKNLLILFLISITLGSVLSVHSFAKNEFPVHKVQIHGPANCRDEINGKILISVPNGTRVKALNRIETHGTWYEISYEGTTCWTSSQNVNDGLDYPSDELNEALEKLPTDSTLKFSDLKLPDGESVDRFMLEKDPCFIVKFPSDESLVKEAKRRCDKLKAIEKK